ncbi:prefoldin subunit alpha [Candidatus Woesearchaeota archaeon]|nr:hypothetical protein [uncultured archaeon]AQS32281.1 hypothetical protein [uncultured archaeon]MBS3149396.1 prefoldin subunit alpha [Candidatus Woesearchaeota archaeon]
MQNNENKINESYVEAQILANQFQQLQEQLSLISNQINDISAQIEYLSDFNNVKENSKLFSQLLPGIFIKTKLENEKKLLINVGANVAVYRSIEEAKDMLLSKINEFKSIEENLKEQFLIVYNKLEEKQHEL